MSSTCDSCNCVDKTNCVNKGNYGLEIVETETSYVETVGMDVAAENDGKCGCGVHCACTNCTCGPH